MTVNIMIVEDEPLLAQRLERFLRASDLIHMGRLSVQPNLLQAKDYLTQHTIDLLFLDLNLHGKNGFDLLKTSVSQAFQTIIVSAYREKAVEAFEYGVLDFIPKPFQQNRIDQALARFTNQDHRSSFPLKYLAVIKNQRLELIRIEDIIYLKGAGNYTELHLMNGRTELHDKSLSNILKLLPEHYERVHKSYIVNIHLIQSISYQYVITLKDQTSLPISRSKYQELKNLIA